MNSDKKIMYTYFGNNFLSEFIERKIVKVERIIMKVLDWIKEKTDYIINNRFITIMQKSIISVSPVLLISSVILLLAELPIVQWKEFLGSEFLDKLYILSDSGFKLLSIYLIAASSFWTFESKKEKSDTIQCISCIIISILVLLMISGNFSLSDYGQVIISFDNLGLNAMFAALIMGIINTELYMYLYNLCDFDFGLKESPTIILDSFLSLLPSLFILITWWGVRYVFNIDMINLVYSAFQPLIIFADNFFCVLLIPFVNRFLWTVGIHGGSFIEAIFSPIFTSMDLSNLESFKLDGTIQFIASGNFFSQYVWVGLFPVCLILIFNYKNKQYKTLGFVSLIPSLFNIDEPVIFGIPVVLNPIMMIPFIFSSVICSILSYIMIILGIIPCPIYYVPWTVPAPIKAFIGCGNDWRAAVWVCILWVLIAVIFYPFIRYFSKNNDVISKKIHN